MKRLIIVMTAIALLLSSCSSISQMMSSGAEAPMWYPGGRNVSGAVCFVSLGTSATRSGARDDALNNLLTQVSGYLGYDVVGRYYRELGANGSVQEIALEIDSTFTSSGPDGTIYYYVLAYAESPVIEPLRSQERLVQEEMNARVSALRESAMENYRSNRDVSAICDLLDAMVIASSYEMLDEANSPQALLETASGWLGQLEIRVSDEDPSKATATVRVVRNRGILSPSVVQAPLSANFPIHAHDGSYGTFFVPFVTGDNGRFVFEEYYPPMASSGTVTFTLDIDGRIDQVAAAAGEAFIHDFRLLCQSISASFDYQMTGRLARSTVMVIMDEFDENGNLLDSSYARDAFIDYLNREGIQTAVASMGDADFSTAIDSIVSNFSQYEWVVWSAVELADVPVQPDDYTVYVAQGYTILLNTRTLEISNIDDISRSVDWGTDRQACLEEIFSLYGYTVASNMTPYF